MSLKLASVFVLIVLALGTLAGCAAVPATGSAQGIGTPGQPVVQVDTAIPPSATMVASEPTAEASATPAAATATVAPTMTIAAAATLAVTAAVTATPAVETPAITPAATPEVAHYQGPNPYRATPQFDVAYNPAVWEYVADDGSGRPSQLKHRTEAGCTIWLRAGPVDAKKVADVFLAGRAWTLAQVQPKVIQYVAQQDDFAWIFGVILPEDYTGMANSNCQDAAEQVIGTFTVVAE